MPAAAGVLRPVPGVVRLALAAASPELERGLRRTVSAARRPQRSKSRMRVEIFMVVMGVVRPPIRR